MMKNIYKDDLTFFEINSLWFKIFTDNIKNILLITALIYIPISIALYYLSGALLNSPDVSLKDFTNYMRIAGWLENLIWVIASIFVIFLVQSSLTNEIKTFKELFNRAISKWGISAWANIMYGIWVWLLTLLLIIPGIIFWILWIFFLQVLLLKENFTPSKALDYSKKLVKPIWWEIFW